MYTVKVAEKTMSSSCTYIWLQKSLYQGPPPSSHRTSATNKWHWPLNQKLDTRICHKLYTASCHTRWPINTTWNNLWHITKICPGPHNPLVYINDLSTVVNCQVSLYTAILQIWQPSRKAQLPSKHQCCLWLVSQMEDAIQIYKCEMMVFG